MKDMKYLGIFLGLLIVIFMSTCAFFSKSLPESIDSPKSEILANKMWDALDKEAWDSTKYVAWTFKGGHTYHWDKQANLAQVEWKNNRVLLDPDKVDGIAFKNGEMLTGASAQKSIQKAWSYWCNDMYWLIAPFKIKDPGTKLTVVEDPSEDRLMVSYLSGGVTPGDTYIWKIDQNGIPQSFEMYVKIIPVKGIEVSWEGWETLSTGSKISSSHKIFGANLGISNIKGGNSLSEVGLSEDIWKDIR